ncbi:MAG: DUF2924 domain-containing protein [Hyphomicrobium sp.]|jgi:hypothetical protein|nr:DUF2924 domain-containing protein [Hyphomicrobium sp.]
MEDESARELADLPELDLDGLRWRWRRLTGRAAPEHITKQLLIRMIAYRIQADAFGDLDGQSIKLLRRIAEQKAKDKAGTGLPTLESLNVSSRGAKSLAPGTVIGREHGGTMHHVMVLAEGFAWNGVTYSSLSEVAFAITGTRWNGPRFFGVKTGGKARAADRKGDTP